MRRPGSLARRRAKIHVRRTFCCAEIEALGLCCGQRKQSHRYKHCLPGVVRSSKMSPDRMSGQVLCSARLWSRLVLGEKFSPHFSNLTLCQQIGSIVHRFVFLALLKQHNKFTRQEHRWQHVLRAMVGISVSRDMPVQSAKLTDKPLNRAVCHESSTVQTLINSPTGDCCLGSFVAFGGQVAAAS